MGKLITIVLLGVLTLVLVAWGPAPKHQSGGNTLRVGLTSPPDSLDPSVSYQAVSWEMQVNAYNGLLTYKKTDDKTATDLVPDLAVAMPKITDGGRTLTFQLRRGIKFGPPLNREVLPSDLKYTFDRNVLMPSQGAFYYDVLDGVDAVKAKKAKSISGVVANDAARTITFHLTEPNATFLYVLALPFSFVVPKGTPLIDQSTEGFVPATGPYMFTEYSPQRRIVMKRNPNFKQWTPDTPSGNVDKIEIDLGVSDENAVTLIQRGKLDAMMMSIPRSKLPQVIADKGWAKQLHKHETSTTTYIFMNTQEAPFNDLRVRQAINWAIDRRAMVKLAGGQGVPTTTILPPTMPGYKDHKLYAKPDLDKARALIHESGIKQGRIDIWCRTTPPNPDMAQYLQGVMNQLGWKAHIRCLDPSAYFQLIGSEKTHAKIGFANWGQDFPEGSNFIDVLLNGAYITPDMTNNYARYHGKDKEIAKANALLDLDQRAAAWGKLDREIVQDAAWAPVMHGVVYTMVSKRLTGYVHHPVYDLLFSKASVDGKAADAGADDSSGDAT